MGATDFYTVAKGTTAQDAFASARRRAQYDHGHSGYTGTIAEKHEFVMIKVPGLDCPAYDDAQRYASKLLEEDDSRVRDKWGPAGCIAMLDNKFLFFGYASC